jgi:acetyl-CoA synthetase (ADP-forming)
VLLEPDALTLCRRYGIPVPKFGVAKELGKALSLAEEIGYPVAMKVVSPQIVHKSDVGGVVLNVGNTRELRKAWRTLTRKVLQRVRDAEIAGVLIEEMLPPGTEVIVGGMKDEQFGNVVVFGLGGIFVEVLRDVSFRASPVTTQDAKQMIAEVKGYPLLRGMRGRQKADVGALARMITRVSRMMDEEPGLSEVDLNPILVWEKGARAADARMIFARENPRISPARSGARRSR